MTKQVDLYLKISCFGLNYQCFSKYISLYNVNVIYWYTVFCYLYILIFLLVNTLYLSSMFKKHGIIYDTKSFYIKKRYYKIQEGTYHMTGNIRR